MKYLFPAVLVACSLALVACSSSDDGDDDDNGSSGSNTSGGSSQSSSGSQSGSGGSKSECTDIDDCEQLTCNCSGLSGAQVRKCTNGVCAKTCEEAGCD